VGVIGAVINTGLLWLFTDLVGIYYLFSSAIAIEIGIIIQFLLNDRWTFREKKTNGYKTIHCTYPKKQPVALWWIGD